MMSGLSQSQYTRFRQLKCHYLSGYECMQPLCVVLSVGDKYRGDIVYVRPNLAGTTKQSRINHISHHDTNA